MSTGPAPRVSVILPLYNKEAYVQRALDSITNQTFADFELIVIDDGSTDNSGRIAAAHSDSRLRIVRQPNAGPGAARNHGIELARADCIAFLDGDDAWMPNYLADGFSALESHGPEVASVTCGFVEFPLGGSTEPMWRQRGLSEGVHRVTADTPAMLLVHMLAYMSCWSTMVRASVIRKWGGFYGKNRCLFAEDAFLWLKILLHEPVLFELTPRVMVHREAADLSKNLRGPRPLEPFLKEPEAIEQVCPAALRALLAQVYTIRAFKTACFWGYWGDWRRAAQLRGRFRNPGDINLPYYWSSLVCATPLGAALGALGRRLGFGL